jgi:hypothetical protein
VAQANLRQQVNRGSGMTKAFREFAIEDQGKLVPDAWVRWGIVCDCQKQRLYAAEDVAGVEVKYAGALVL